MATLFGPSPAEVLMARQKEQEQMDMLRQQQISQQGSQFGVFAPLYQAGLQFGDIGASAMRQGLFPQQADPALQKATAIQGVLSKYQGEDFNSAETLTKIAKDLSAIDPEAGIRAGELALKRQKESKIIQGKPGEIIYRQTPTGLEKVAEIPDKAKELSPTDKAKNVIFELSEKQNRTAPENALLKSAQNVLASTRPQTINNILAQGSRNVLDVDKKQAEKYLDVQNSALSSLGVLGRMQDVVKQGIVTGTLAEERTAFLTGLDSLGLSTQKAKNVIGNTELFQKETEALVQQILKVYGYNPSNVDVIRAVKSVPSTINSPGGLTRLLDSLVNVKQQELAESTRALDYFRDKDGSFKDFKPKIPVMAPKQSGIQSLSDDELKKIIEGKK